MAKLTIDTNHAYESRAGKMTVGEALAWVAKHATTEDEESGEVSTYEPGDLVCYAVRRMQALHKDGARFAKGHKPSRIYTPRVQVEGAAKNADAVKEAAREALAKAIHVEVTKAATSNKPARLGRHAARDAKVAANNRRIAELEAALAAKREAPKAKPAARPEAKPAKRPGVHVAKRDESSAAPVTVSDYMAMLMAAE